MHGRVLLVYFLQLAGQSIIFPSQVVIGNLNLVNFLLDGFELLL